METTSAQTGSPSPEIIVSVPLETNTSVDNSKASSDAKHNMEATGSKNLTTDFDSSENKKPLHLSNVDESNIDGGKEHSNTNEDEEEYVENVNQIRDSKRNEVNTNVTENSDNIPLFISEASKNIPVLTANITEAAEIIPVATENINEADVNNTEGTEDLPLATENITEVAENNTEVIENIPVATDNIIEAAENINESIEIITDAAKNITNATKKIKNIKILKKNAEPPTKKAKLDIEIKQNISLDEDIGTACKKILLNTDIAEEHIDSCDETNEINDSNYGTEAKTTQIEQPIAGNNTEEQSSLDNSSSNSSVTKTIKMLEAIGTSLEIVDQANINKGCLDQPSSSAESSNHTDNIDTDRPVILTDASNLSSDPIPMDTYASENQKYPLFGEDKGPHWHKVVSNLVTPPVIVSNLPKIFQDLPIFDVPDDPVNLEEFYDNKIRDFVGSDLNDMEYEELQNYCSIDNLKTGKEISMPTKVPQPGNNDLPETIPNLQTMESPHLVVLSKLKTRLEKDQRNLYSTKLKYRGVRTIPISSQGGDDTSPPDLEPGKDVLYRIRVYRPFVFSSPRTRTQIRGRHSVFSCDIVMLGRHPLSLLRDRLVCRNDADMRLDVSNRPHARAHTTAKDMFPSGFLFINNVFYVDGRAACRDTSAVLRRWAAARGLGDFPVRDMAQVRLGDVAVRLAHPEVYMHQGNCEHLFLFSEIRLLSYSDPLHSSTYPLHTSISNNQTIYCTTCAEYGAKWIVTGCDRVPFDPAFFCDICFKQYLYKDGKKIGDFKAFSYRGNELSVLKPQC